MPTAAEILDTLRQDRALPVRCDACEGTGDAVVETGRTVYDGPRGTPRPEERLEDCQRCEGRGQRLETDPACSECGEEFFPEQAGCRWCAAEEGLVLCRDCAREEALHFRHCPAAVRMRAREAV